MSRVRGKDTKPELLIRKFLHSKGFRYRLHPSNLIGKPDIVLPKYKTVIFVHGCFWHQHQGCKKANLPKSNRQFWEKKLNNNIKRDLNTKTALESQGWRVIVVWECETKQNPNLIVDNILSRGR